MMTKDQILKCTDLQTLADEVAVRCMGWAETNHGGSKGWFNNTSLIIDDWQPHLPTEKGKAQCFDLAQKCNLELDFVLNCARYDDNENELTYEVNDENMQIAILKAALLSELGE